jgi:hypothetical protein
MRAPITLLFALSCATLAAGSLAQQPAPSQSVSSSLGVVVFPAKGQAADKQAADEGECFAWSKGQTGIDPFAPPPAPPAQASATPPPPAPTGARVKGAVRGAAAGAVIGEVASNDADKGAAIGATVGVMRGGQQARRAQQQQQAQAQQQQQAQAQQAQASQQAQRDTFNKGFAACMEGKGYTVK